MRRTHVSPKDDPITVEPRDQVAKAAMKPKGFWYEVDGDWRRWCEDERMEWGKGFLHRVDMGDERMLLIETVAELDDFDDEYHEQKYIAKPSYGIGPYWTCNGIRWDRVAAEYDGIEIAPYQWERRLDGHLWYYGWDCASGVIWRPQGVNVALLQVEAVGL